MTLTEIVGVGGTPGGEPDEMTGDELRAPDYGPGVPFGPDEGSFERSHVVEVSVQIAPEDWNALRSEGMSFGEIRFPSGGNGVRVVPEYTEFSAQVTVDGIVHENVSMKKKGYIGSLSAIRPSMKFNFSKNFDEKLAAGMKRMTLNNDRQDPSHLRQCMAYDLFTQLGLPSPRCNYAHVVVNGKDLGTYTNLEPIKKPMLARFFEDTGGNMYEGELSDFAPETVDQLELKTNKTEADRSDLQPVIDALALNDDQVVEALGLVVDLDSFFDFWALETLIGHWDGYAGNRNNYRAYHDPTTDRFFFIPWGMDQAFEGDNPTTNTPFLSAVYAKGVLSNRLYELPDQRERYRTRLAELVDELWDVPKLLAQVDELQALSRNGVATNVEEQRSYIRDRGVSLLAALEQPAPPWADDEPRPAPLDECQGTTLEFSGEFSTIWTDDPTNIIGDLAAQRADSSGDLQLQDAAIEGDFFSHVSAAGVSDDSVALHHRALMAIETVDADGRLWFLVMNFPRESISPGFHYFHGLESTGTVVLFDFVTGQQYVVGSIGGGGIQFDEAGLLEGNAVSGSFETTVFLDQCVSNILAESEQLRVDNALVAEEEAAAAAEAEGEGAEGGQADPDAVPVEDNAEAEEAPVQDEEDE